jgi:5'-nucleotidase
LKNRPLIFITNDDGIGAPGIRALIEIMRGLGRVVVVAPDKPQSGTGHAITMNTPLRLKKIVDQPGYKEYSCNGTPVDCVKLGFKVVVNGRPDLLVSGVNHGSNASINIIYSGTMAGVLEGSMASVPSIGFSLDDYSHDADMEPAKRFIRVIAENVFKYSLPDGVCLNVNIPGIPLSSIKGIRICRQAGGTWQEDFDERIDPGGMKYYWLKGIFVRKETGEDTDVAALEQGYVAVVPIQFDFTAVKAIAGLRKWKMHG